MIDAYSESTERTTFDRRLPSFAVLVFAVLMIILSVALFMYLRNNRPAIKIEKREHILARIESEHRCESNEKAHAEEFATGLYRVECVGQ